MGGIYITSGIIDDKEETGCGSCEKNAGLEVLDITYQGEWVCVTARKKLKSVRRRGMQQFLQSRHGSQKVKF